MISIHHLDGYKYIGDHPDAQPGRGTDTFRDNLTYMNLSFSDWEADKNKLLFICEQHLGWLNMELLERVLLPCVVDNAIARLHLIIGQNDGYDEQGGIKFMTEEGEDPGEVMLKAGQEEESVLALIARKKHFYRVELPAKKAAAWEALLKPKKKLSSGKSRKKPKELPGAQ